MTKIFKTNEIVHVVLTKNNNKILFENKKYIYVKKKKIKKVTRNPILTIGVVRPLHFSWGWLSPLMAK
jgi:hypothetical protein